MAAGMPELPEVEAARCLVERHCGGSRLKAVNDLEAGGGPRDGQFDEIVICEGVRAGDLAAALVGRKLANVRRKGKQLWFELGGTGKHKAVLFHFGMTGAFVVKGHAALKYQEFTVRDEQWPPRFCKLELVFANGAHLAFADPRRLGRVRLRTDPLNQPPISQLAPDPLTDASVGMNLAAFASALRTTAAPIKASLLDQERAVCGVGNWVADEALYLAKVHPQAVSNKLGDAQVAELLAAVRTVCRVACDVGADSELFPKEWLFHARWGRDSKPGTSRTLEDGRRVAFSTVAGRTTATVPAEQGRTPSYGEQSVPTSTRPKKEKQAPSKTSRKRQKTEAGATAATGRTTLKSQNTVKITTKTRSRSKSKAEAEWAEAEAEWNSLEEKAEAQDGAMVAPCNGRDGGGEAEVISEVRTEILRIAKERGSSKSLCPSEVPRGMGFSGTEWRSKMDLVRSVGISLVEEGKIVVMQKGRVLSNPAEARGPIRYRISSNEQQTGNS